MSAVDLFRRSPLPWLLYRTHLSLLKLRAPITLGVRTLIVDDQNRVLLIRHSYRPGWYLPGGGVKKWETMEEAACRESREEAGVDPLALDRLVGFYANFEIGRPDHVALYLVRRWRPVPHNSWEIANVAFAPWDDLPPDTTDATRRRVEEFMGLRPPDNRW